MLLDKNNNYFNNLPDKINIYLDEDTYNTIISDIEIFCFASKNDYISTIIENYGKTYREKYKDAYKTIFETIKENFPTTDKNINKATIAILKSLKNDKKENDKKCDKVISYRFQSKLEDERIEIQSYLKQHNIITSDYFRSFLQEFCDLSIENKEKILLADKVNKIDKAIEDKNNLWIKTNDKRDIVCSPYVLLASNDTGFNFLIGVKNNEIITCKLSNIKYCGNYDSVYDIPDDLLDELKKRRKNPTFAYESTSKIYVLLTDEGLKNLSAIKTLRPIGSKTENIKDLPKDALKEYKKVIKKYSAENLTLYCFDASFNQALYYFERFGANAIVIWPIELNNTIKAFYQEAVNRY